MKQDKIVNLALEDLDIEEMEKRIELAPATTAAGWCGCGGGDCSGNCTADCGALCGANVVVGGKLAAGPTC